MDMSAELAGCVIVSGMPGAGKSTLTELAAGLVPRAAQVKADDVNEMILSGRVRFNGEPPAEAARQVELCDRNLCSLAGNFIDFGFTVFVDQIIVDRAELDFVVGLLAPRPVWLVTLAPTVEVCRHRNAIRDPDESWEFDGYHQLDADMRRELGSVGWWFDTSLQTPRESAEQLVREAVHRAALK
jgi:chloramphenicol 3-O-phosphotransferase